MHLLMWKNNNCCTHSGWTQQMENIFKKRNKTRFYYTISLYPYSGKFEVKKWSWLISFLTIFLKKGLLFYKAICPQIRCILWQGKRLVAWSWRVEIWHSLYQAYEHWIEPSYFCDQFGGDRQLLETYIYVDFLWKVKSLKRK